MIGNFNSAAKGIIIALRQNSAVTTFLGSALSIYQEIAKQGEPFPLILVISLPSPDDVRNSSDDLIMGTPYFRVIGCCEGRAAYEYLEPLVEAIDAAVHKIGFMVNGNRLDFTRVRQYRRTYFDTKHYTQSGVEIKAVVQ